MTEWMTSTVLAGLPGMPSTDRAIQLRAKREGWQYRARQARGGGREYHISSLPEQTRIHLAAQLLNNTPCVGTAVDLVADAAKNNAVCTSVGGPSILAGRDKCRAEARLHVLLLLDQFARASCLSPKKAIHQFCVLYSCGDMSVPDDVRAEVPDVHPSTIYRWRQKLQSEGLQRLGGGYGNRKGTSKIDSQPELQEFALGLLTCYPHTSASGMADKMRHRFGNRDDIEMPSDRAVERWLRAWKANNKQLFTAISNPDDWKNKYQAAFGSRSEDVIALNQLWELDSTPADVMLLDGRHSIIGCIDVYSRRPKMLVSKTSKAAAIVSLARNCLLEWGVPDCVKTDNGQDYKSKHLRGAFMSLDVGQDFCKPFTPEEKPHIERFLGIWSHGMVEYLPGFIGHSVAERKAIEARKSFAQRMMKHGEVVEIAMTSADLQEICDLWVEHIYMHSEHSGIGETPFQRVANWRAPMRRIDDVRALDLMLIEESTRTIRKKGIRIDGGHYIHPDLVSGNIVNVGDSVIVKRDPADVGRIYVFGGDPLRFVCVAEDPDITGISRRDVAIHAKRKQLANRREAAAYLRQLQRNTNVKGIAKEVLASAAAANNITMLPPSYTNYTTDALGAAGDAARAHQTPRQTVTVSDEERAALQAELDVPAQVVEASNPLHRYRRWARIEQRIERGDYVSPADRDGLASYQKSSEYVSMASLADDLDDDVFALVD